MRFVLLCLRATASGENFKTLLPLPSPPSKHYFRSLLTCAGSLFVFRVKCGRAAPGAGSQLTAGRYSRWMFVRCGADEMQLRGGLTVTASPYCCFFMTEELSHANHRKHDSSFFYKWDYRQLPHSVWEWFGSVRAVMSSQLKLHSLLLRRINFYSLRLILLRFIVGRRSIICQEHQSMFVFPDRTSPSTGRQNVQIWVDIYALKSFQYFPYIYTLIICASQEIFQNWFSIFSPHYFKLRMHCSGVFSPSADTWTDTRYWSDTTVEQAHHVEDSEGHQAWLCLTELVKKVMLVFFFSSSDMLATRDVAQLYYPIPNLAIICADTRSQH